MKKSAGNVWVMARRARESIVEIVGVGVAVVNAFDVVAS